MTTTTTNLVHSADSDKQSNHLKLSLAIIQAVSEQKRQNDFTDCTVVVAGKEFSSHRFVLSACSGFFRALFVSGMVEDRDRRVNIVGISQETFSLILDCIFKAEDIVNTDNMIDIWHATNQLDIAFLLKHCEDFITKNITCKNCLDIYKNANLVDCERIVKLTWATILKEFYTLRNSEEILNLSLADIKSLLANHDLNVTSEDHVIDFIIRWISHDVPNEKSIYTQLELVEEEDLTHQVSLSRPNSVCAKEENGDSCSFGEYIGLREIEDSSADLQDPKFCSNMSEKNDGSISSNICDLVPTRDNEHNKADSRSEHIAELLAVSRYCLISGRAIETLLSNKIILSNEKAMSLIKESICYQLLSPRHGSLTANTIHRASSNLQNVIGWLGGTYEIVPKTQTPLLVLTCMSIDNQNIQQIIIDLTKPLCPVDSTVYNNCIYIVSSKRCYTFDCLIRKLISVSSLLNTRTGHSITSVGEYIYVLGGDCLEVERITAGNRDDWKKVGTIHVFTTNSTTVVVGTHIIILGCSEERNDTTVVQCFNTETFTSYQMNDIAGPPQRIMTFTKGDQTFVLFRTGALWKMEASDTGVISTRYVTLLWDFDRNLNGAALCRDQLYLFDHTFSSKENAVWSISVPGVFESIKNLCYEGTAFRSLVISN